MNASFSRFCIERAEISAEEVHKPSGSGPSASGDRAYLCSVVPAELAKMGRPKLAARHLQDQVCSSTVPVATYNIPMGDRAGDRERERERALYFCHPPPVCEIRMQVS